MVMKEITRDLPGVKENQFSHLDGSGIVKNWNICNSGMILVGKVTPKVRLNQLWRDFRAILVKKLDMLLINLWFCPTSMEGTVVDVKVLLKRLWKVWKSKAEIELKKNEVKSKHLDKLLMLDRRNFKNNDLF